MKRRWMQQGFAVALGLGAALFAWKWLQSPDAAPVTARSVKSPDAKRVSHAPRALPRKPVPVATEAQSHAAATEPATQHAAEDQADPAIAGDVAPASSQVNPSGQPTRVEQLRMTVLQEAVRRDWVSVNEHGAPCPPQQLRILYGAPADLARYTKGAYFEPLGPEPSNSSQEINGLLICEGYTHLYRGFEAFYRPDRDQWDVFPFPVIE